MAGQIDIHETRVWLQGERYLLDADLAYELDDGIMEAYLVEVDYGRTIEAYKGTLDVEGASREVDFLRIGRIALLYETVDAEIYGMWDRQAKEWKPLPTEYRNQIRDGIKMAHKQIAPNLVKLPIQAPEVVQ